MFIHIPIQVPSAKQINLPNGKRLYETPNGNKYPSITTVLGAKEKPFLKDWKALLGDKKANKEIQRCSERGTAIHTYAEKYLNNEDPISFLKAGKSEHVAGFNQIKLKLNKINNIRTQETALYSDQLQIAGTVDCIADFACTPCIIDFKTSTNIKKEEWIEDYKLQCTAYALMWNELTEDPIDTFTIIMMVERGIVPVVFTEKIDKYIHPLLKRVKEYHRK